MSGSSILSRVGAVLDGPTYPLSLNSAPAKALSFTAEKILQSGKNYSQSDAGFFMLFVHEGEKAVPLVRSGAISAAPPGLPASSRLLVVKTPTLSSTYQPSHPVLSQPLAREFFFLRKRLLSETGCERACESEHMCVRD